MKILELLWSHRCPLVNPPQLKSLLESESESELLHDWLFTANQFAWRKAPWDSRPEFFFFNWTFAVIVFMQHPIWQEDGSVVHNFCWFSPAQSFSGPCHAGLINTFYCLRFETAQPGGPGLRIYILQEQGGPVITPGTGFPFRRLLRTRRATVEVFELSCS
jgi:hypothetical protein